MSADARAGVLSLSDNAPESFPATPGNRGPEHAMPQGQFPPSAGKTNGLPQPGSAPQLEIISYLCLMVPRWHWLAAGGALCCAIGIWIGAHTYSTEYSAMAKLIPFEPVQAVESFRPRPLSARALDLLARSPELLERVGKKLQPPASARQLESRVGVMQERNTEVLMVAADSASPEEAVHLANLYAEEVLQYTREFQAEEASEVSRVLNGQLHDANVEIANLKGQAAQASALLPPSLSQSPTLLARLNEERTKAREELSQLLVDYTEAHPLVLKQQSRLRALEEQVSALPAPAEGEGSVRAASALQEAGRTGGTTALERDANLEVILTQLTALENGRWSLLVRQRAAQAFADNPPGYYKLYAEASRGDVGVTEPTLKIILLGLLCGFTGAFVIAGAFLVGELADDRLKTAGDLSRVAQLPLLASFGELKPGDSFEGAPQALRTWFTLRNRLRPMGGGRPMLCCGIAASSAGEGRSTLARGLAQAASQCGFRVLRISITSTTAPQGHASSSHGGIQGSLSEAAVLKPLGLEDILASPSMVACRLDGQTPPRVVETSLTGAIWDAQRNEEWRLALSTWSQIDRLVVLVELPPVLDVAAVGLAASLPNILWLASSGRAKASATCEQLQLLRAAGCHLVGAVLNHDPVFKQKHRFSRWLPEPV